MTLFKPLAFGLVLLNMNSCVLTTGNEPASGEVPTLTAPSAKTPRMADCIGENQSSKGKTRKDCLPNDADAAARDTQAGGGFPIP